MDTAAVHYQQQRHSEEFDNCSRALTRYRRSRLPEVGGIIAVNCPQRSEGERTVERVRGTVNLGYKKVAMATDSRGSGELLERHRYE
jgi:hypothetical protein